MSLDWCPGIREVCVNWRDAPMLQQTFEALERTFEQDNDACIDCSKTVVEVVCQTIVTSFHSKQKVLRPLQGTPTLADWLSAAVKALKLGDVRDDKFRKLVSSHHKLSEALNDLRNKAGPASHGKDPYLERLATHHRRSAVLAADAIVTFLYNAYLDTQLDPGCSREPWERFEAENKRIDSQIFLDVSQEYDDSPTLRFQLPGGDELPIKIEISRLLYLIDREAYVEALNATRNVSIETTDDDLGGV